MAVPEGRDASARQTTPKSLLVVEMSMGQMVDDVQPCGIECRVPVHFYGRTGGVIPTPKEILGEIDKLLK